jgi:hypothetical protein
VGLTLKEPLKNVTLTLERDVQWGYP